MLFGKMSLKPFRSLLIIIVFIRECRSESCKTSAHGACSFSDIFLEPYYSHVEAISFAEIDKHFG